MRWRHSVVLRWASSTNRREPSNATTSAPLRREVARIAAVAARHVQHALAGLQRQESIGGRHHQLAVKLIRLASRVIPPAGKGFPGLRRVGVQGCKLASFGLLTHAGLGS